MTFRRGAGERAAEWSPPAAARSEGVCSGLVVVLGLERGRTFGRGHRAQPATPASTDAGARGCGPNAGWATDCEMALE